MSTLLLLIIYIVYIGLGLPDSITGAAWPAIYEELGIPVSAESAVTVIISLCTVLASFFSAKIINKFGTGIVTAFSTLLTAIALIGNSFAPNLFWLCVCSVPAGFGAGAIDAALNNYAALHYKPSQLSFLHCFYGIGVAASPFIMSFALKNEGWRQGYRLVFYIQITITAIAFLSLIIWKKVSKENAEEENFTPKNLSLIKMAKNKAIRISWLVFFSTCALEFTCNHWGATFLVGSEGAAKDVAAEIVSLYFLGITSGRLVSGFLNKILKPQTIIVIGYGIVGIAITTLFLPVPVTVKGVALFMIGLGNGPSFPNLTYLTPHYFGKSASQSIISSQMAMCNLGILIIPTIFGIIAEKISIKAFPVYALTLYAVIIISTAIYMNCAERNKNNA